MNNENKNTISIIGFILSFIFGIPGLILSVMGLKKSKITNTGNGLAIAGIIISSIKIFVTMIAIIIIFPFIMIHYAYKVTNLPNDELKDIKSTTETYNCDYAYDCHYDNNGDYMCKYDTNNGNIINIECNE